MDLLKVQDVTSHNPSELFSIMNSLICLAFSLSFSKDLENADLTDSLWPSKFFVLEIFCSMF